MTDRDVHSAVVKWLASLLSVEVVKAHQGLEMTPPYVMVNFTTRREVRQEEQEVKFEDDGTDIVATPVIETEWNFSVHAYGPNPTDILRPIVSASKLTQVIEPLWPTYSLQDVSEIRNVPDWVNEAWEPRAQIDLFLRGLVKDGHKVDAIEQYSFEFQ